MLANTRMIYMPESPSVAILDCAVPACDQMKPLRLPTIAPLTYKVRLQR